MEKFTDMTVSELESRCDEVLGELADIKAQIEHAKAQAVTRGIYADADWFVRARQALRHRGAEHQRINTELAKRKKQLRANNAGDYGQRFIDAARKILPPELLQQIFHAASERG